MLILLYHGGHEDQIKQSNKKKHFTDDNVLGYLGTCERRHFPEYLLQYKDYSLYNKLYNISDSLKNTFGSSNTEKP